MKGILLFTSSLISLASSLAASPKPNIIAYILSGGDKRGKMFKK